MPSLKEKIKKLMPEKIRMSQLVLRRASVWQKTGVIFIHVPKNGGTSINDAIYGRFMGHFRACDIERIRPKLLNDIPSIAVTRNPWARSYSAWSFARKGVAMKDGAQIWNAGRYQNQVFDSFERFVLEWLPQRDLSKEDYVFRPQVHFLLNRHGDLGVQHLGNIEDPTSYLDYLTDAIGHRLDIRHLNRSTNPMHYRNAYTPEMQETLARCYASDFELFDYDF